MNRNPKTTKANNAKTATRRTLTVEQLKDVTGGTAAAIPQTATVLRCW